jgi:protein gp37
MGEPEEYAWRMAGKTAIGWCDCTFNPWWGCVEVSPECELCYARVWAKFTGHAVWGKDTSRRFFGDEHWDEPFRWQKDAERSGERRRVFCASMADILEERDDETGRQMQRGRLRLWSVIADTPALDWILLTKRAGAMARLIPEKIRAMPNVWPGVTCGHPDSLWRVEKLVALGCAGPRWVSVEPLLGRVDLRPWLPGFGRPEGSTQAIRWAVFGGESGAGYRAMDLSWLESSVREFRAAGVPVFVKQDSASKPGRRGRIPDELWIHEWPP